MRTRIGGGLISIAGLVGSTVVTMMWPEISPAIGWPILTICAFALITGLWLLSGRSLSPSPISVSIAPGKIKLKDAATKVYRKMPEGGHKSMFRDSVIKGGPIIVASMALIRWARERGQPVFGRRQNGLPLEQISADHLAQMTYRGERECLAKTHDGPDAEAFWIDIHITKDTVSSYLANAGK